MQVVHARDGAHIAVKRARDRVKQAELDDKAARAVGPSRRAVRRVVRARDVPREGVPNGLRADRAVFENAVAARGVAREGRAIGVVEVVDEGDSPLASKPLTVCLTGDIGLLFTFLVGTIAAK